MRFKQLLRKKDIVQIVQEAEAREKLGTNKLSKNLTLKDLTSLGIAAIVGTGVFSTIGQASANGGPAVVFLFIFTAIACIFSALCYAEFASTLPIAGSAYTYAYTTFGELVAWIIGWDLLMEYAIGNIAVAISWSDYFTALANGLLKNWHTKIPEYFSMDYVSAYRGYQEAISALGKGEILTMLSDKNQIAYEAWTQAPSLFGLKLIADLPALCITGLITYLVYIGIHESKRVGNLLVLLKVVIVLLVVLIGAFYIKPENWSPFAPNGVAGVLKGVSAVFFAYIGFDAISTTAEECKAPQRDLPKAMLYALFICTILYILVVLVLTGMVKYDTLAVGDPLAFVFEKTDLHFMAGIISISAIIAIASVLLVYQLGQPRIWMSMSRDGLLPPIFGRIHPKYKTPSFSTILTGFVVGVPALFMNLTEVTDLSSIGTLFAFTLVCGGILIIQLNPHKAEAKFKVPYYNGKYIVPTLLLLLIFLLYQFNHENFINFLSFKNNFAESIPLWCFIILAILISYLTFKKNLSLLPVLGLLTNLYLMTELGVTNWIRFLGWLAIGLVIYFTYGYKYSKLKRNHSQDLT